MARELPITLNRTIKSGDFGADAFLRIPAGTYDVVDLDTGTTVVAGAAYTTEDPIIFDGIDTYISGRPAAGDTFQIVSGQQEDVFTTASGFADALKQPFTNATERAATRQLIDNALSGFNQSLESLSTVRSRIGARLQVVETSRSENDAVNIQLEHTRSDLEDTDMTEAVVRLENQSTTLELLYKSFQRVDSLSLFDYL